MKRHVNVVNALRLAAVNNLLTHAKPCCAELVTGSPKGSLLGCAWESMITSHELARRDDVARHCVLKIFLRCARRQSQLRI